MCLAQLCSKEDVGVSCLVLKMIALPSPRGLQHEVLWSEQGSWKGWGGGERRDVELGLASWCLTTRSRGVSGPDLCHQMGQRGPSGLHGSQTHPPLRKTRSTGTGGGTGCQALSWSDLKSRRGRRAGSRATGQNLWAWDWRLRFALRKEQESRSEMNPCKRAGGLNRALEVS